MEEEEEVEERLGGPIADDSQMLEFACSIRGWTKLIQIRIKKKVGCGFVMTKVFPKKTKDFFRCFCVGLKGQISVSTLGHLRQAKRAGLSAEI